MQFHGPVREAVHRLKFDSRSDVGRALAEELTPQVLRWARAREASPRIDVVTCIPLSDLRLAERGFNQAGILARAVAQGLGVPFLPRAVRRLRDTTKQSSLGRDERAANVASAFCAVRDLVDGKVVLLVDDVVTTGETLGAASRALLEAGARAVDGVALARAGSSDPSVNQGGSSRDARGDRPRRSR